MEWIWLTIAGCMEITWAVSMKFTEEFTRLWPSLLTVVAMLASVFFLDLSLRSIPLGTAYAVWTGIGAAGTVLIGMFWLGEPRDIGRLVCIFLIIAGVIGLKFNI